jgi:hypothetical protein
MGTLFCFPNAFAASALMIALSTLLVTGMVQAWVGQKRLKRYILRRFSNRS